MLGCTRIFATASFFAIPIRSQIVIGMRPSASSRLHRLLHFGVCIENASRN
jgi:hypothetical protein